MRKSLIRVMILAVAPTVLACHGAHGFDLTLGPYLTLASSAPDQVTISWAGDYQTAHRYDVERRRKGRAGFRVIATVPAGTTQYTDMKVKPGYRYFYRVRGYWPKHTARTVILKVDVPQAPPLSVASSTSGSPTYGEIPYLGLTPGEPRLSPDGSSLVFASGGHAYLESIDGGAPRLLPTPSLGPVSGAAWFPDGSSLVLAAESAGGTDLYEYSIATGSSRRIPGTNGGEEPTVAPNGSSIVFTRPDGLYSTSLDSASSCRLNGGSVGAPRYSPSGDRLAWLERNGSVDSLMVSDVKPDGAISPPRRVADDASGLGPVVFSPSGAAVAYRTETGGVSEVQLDAEEVGPR